MKVDTVLPGALAAAADDARQAERLGYDLASSVELTHDPLLTLALAAPATTRIGLGTAILVAFARSPMTTAYTAWDLQHLSRGRIVLGLGSQVRPHVTRRFSMPWSQPAARMREYVQALRAIWQSWQHRTPLKFRGEFYQHTLMTPAFSPDPCPDGPPKVMVAAVGERMTRAAAEVADGVLLHGFTTARYVREVTLPVIEAALAGAGRERAAFDIRFSPFLVTGRTEEEQRRADRQAREQIAFYGSTPAYLPVLALHGWEDLHHELHRLSMRGQWEQMADLIDDDVLGAFAVVAEPERLAEEVARRAAGIATRVGFAPTAGVADDLHQQWVSTLKTAPAWR